MLLLLKFRAPDGGLLYTETNLNSLLPEPLNTLTSCFFFLLAVYWIVRLKGFTSRHSFLSIASWLLLIGSVGGTIYHGLRKYPVFILMDWLPILLLCIMASAWFWIKVLQSPAAAAAVFIIFFLIEAAIYYLRKQEGEHLAANLNYAFMAAMVLIPVILYLIKIRFFQAKWVFAALLSFCAALFFRIADAWPLLHFGTHFLWHIFGVIAVYSMFRFIYLLNEEKMHVIYSDPSLGN